MAPLRVLAVMACLGVSLASCPNDCSGNGECNIYSACECHRNWMGADCSQRVCYFGVAYVDTPQGDLNADGYVSDSTYKTRFTNEPTWEVYPTYAGWGSVNYQWKGLAGSVVQPTTVVGDSGGEAHFYKECSAKGTCDRSSGVCDCYAGYEGGGCTRVACPNDCSGHGACRTIEERKFAGPSYHEGMTYGSFDYSAWDNDVSQSCVCDAGYTGIDCSMRQCPMGDDPVTKFESYTKITFARTTASTGHDLGASYGSLSYANDASGAGSPTPEGVKFDDAFGFTARVWGQPGGSGDSPDLFTNKLGWNPWYVDGDKPVEQADGDSACFYQDHYMCETRGVKYAAAATSTPTDMAGTVAFTHDLVVVGTKSGARGVQRRQPMGGVADTPMPADDGAGQSLQLMGPGCCYYDAAAEGDVNCEQCDFFSLYLSDVEGEFQTGDHIRISWDGSSAQGAEEIHNNIESISTYYNTKRVQHEEEQVLKIYFPAANVAAKSDGTNFKGYFSLTFTDEFGDEYTTEAISASVAAACNPERLGHDCANGGDAVAAATTTCDDNSGTPNYYDTSLHGDFVIHSAAANVGLAATPTCADMSVASIKPTTYYHALVAEAAPQDYAGGWALAATIEKALEALPNGVTGDVQVEYAYNAEEAATDEAGVPAASGGTDTGWGAFGTTNEYGSASERYFVIRFLGASGDLPELKVNYAFTAGGEIYTNQECGAQGELVDVIDGGGAAPYDSTGFVKLGFASGDVVCEEDPIVTARVPTATSGDSLTAGTIKGITIDYPGKGCRVISGGAGVNDDGTVLVTFSLDADGFDNIGQIATAPVTGMGVVDGETVNSATVGDKRYAVVGVFSQAGTGASGLLSCMSGGLDAVKRTVDEPGTVGIVDCTDGANTLNLGSACANCNDKLQMCEADDGFGICDGAAAGKCLGTGAAGIKPGYERKKAGAAILQSTTVTAVDATSGVNGAQTDLYNSQFIWQRNGVTKGLGVRGTTENVECSNRGTCDYSSGTCQCFTGFSSKDCSTQNSLASGA